MLTNKMETFQTGANSISDCQHLKQLPPELELSLESSWNQSSLTCKQECPNADTGAAVSQDLGSLSSLGFS